MKFWMWISAKFWWLWGVNASLAVIVLLIFLSGLVSGWVGSHNLIPWCGILLIGAAIVGGSLWLRSHEHPGIAVFTLLMVLVPAVLTVGGGLLFSAFYMLLYFFGKGRTN